MRAQGAAPGGGTPGHGRIDGNSQKYTPLTPQQVSDLELRNAAVHEAAHAVVAQFLGYLAMAEIFATPDPGPEDKLWIGRTKFYQQITGGQDNRFISLAGTVAEEVDDDHDVEAQDIADWLEGGAIELSATDARMAGGYSMKDLEGTVMLVRHLWEEIEAKASWLMRWARE